MVPPDSIPADSGHPEIVAFPERVPLSAGTFRKPLHLAIGMFDGVHRGHQAVIQQAMDAVAGDLDECAGVLTFDPHPSRVLYPERATSLLMPLGQRIERMLRFGVDHVFVQSFTRDYARREADEFAASLLAFFHGLKSLHIGENFRFGAKRSGDVTTLEESGRRCGIEVHALDRAFLDGEPISSSHIRKALSSGNIRKVNAMLGYPYTIQGTIQPGNQVGRGLGFPTLNIPWAREAVPRFGVYRTALKTAGNGPCLPGIANYGLRPTVGDAREPLLEVHLIDPGGIPRTGEHVRVALLEFIRPERNFPSMDALKIQIRKDAEIARAHSIEDDLKDLENF